MTKIYRHTLFAVFILINLFGRAQTFLQENFDSSIPGTFTITDAGGATGDSWISGQQGGSNSLNGTNAAIVNSDANGNGTLLLETMTTPVLNTSGATLLFLDFDQYYRNFGTDSAIVEVFNGAVWVPVLSQNGSDVGAFNNPDQQHIDITAHKNAAMQVRFRYNDNNNWAWYWLVDNLHIYEGQCPRPDPTFAFNVTDSSATLDWIENGTATSWEVEWGLSGFAQGSGTSFVTNTKPDTLFGLTANTSYDFYVRAICGPADTSIWSILENFTTVATCAMPDTLSLDTLTTTSADLDWVEMGSATTWQIEWDSASFALGTGNLVTTSTKPFQITGLSPNGLYGYYVRAICGPADTSVWSPISLFVTPASCPDPDTLTVSNIDATSVHLGWAETGSATTWQIEWDTVGFVPGNGNFLITTTNPHVLSGLTPNQSYAFYVRSICAPGDTSSWSAVKTFVATSCPTPSGLQVSNILNTSVILSWTENGSATNWEVEWGAAGFTPGSGNSVTTISNPGLLENLMSGTDYDFYVRSICGVGDTSLLAGPVNFETDTACRPPSNKSVTNITATSVDLSWNENGSATSWEIEWDTTGFVKGTGNTIVTSSNPYNLTGLTPGVTYDFNVRAICGSDSSIFTPPPTTFTPLGCPPPMLLSANSITETSADLEWLESGSATSWQIQWDTVSAGFGQPTATYAITSSNPYSLTGLSSGAHYTYYVRSICGVGDTSTWSGPLTFILESCPIPDNKTVTELFSTSANLHWDENGLATSWQIEWDTVGFTQGTGNLVTTSTNPHNLTGLTPDTRYEFYVRSICASGDTSAWDGSPTIFWTPETDSANFPPLSPVTIEEDSVVTLCYTALNGMDADSILICGNGGNYGTSSIVSNCIVYDPDTNYIGNDTICFITCKNGTCDSNWVHIVVTPVRDTISISTPEDIDFIICDTTLNSVSADSVLLCGDGNHGTTTITGNCFTFDPDSNFVGQDTTCYVVCHDGFCDTTIITWSITPVTDTITLTTLEDINFIICDTTLNNGLNADSVQICGEGNHGTTTIAGNCFTFDPDSNFIGLDTTCYTVCHDGFCDTTIITWSITPVIDTLDITLLEDVNFNICDTVLNNGLNADSVVLCQDGGYGTTTIAGNCFTFDPDSNFIGLDTACYAVCHDGFCDTTIITFTFNPVMDTISISTPEDNDYTICDTTLNDGLKADSVLLCGDGNHGRTSVTGNCFTFDPDSNYVGLDTTCYVVCHDGLCDTTIVTWSIIPVTDTITLSTPEDIDFTTCDTTLNNGLNADSVQICGDGNHGTTTLLGNCFTFDPDSNYIGLDTTCYTVCHDGFCDTTIIAWSVTPVIDTISISTLENINFILCDTALNNGLNADSVQICGDGNHGTTTIAGNCLTFDLDSNFIGLDTTCYAVCHDGFCDTTFVAIVVNPVLDTISTTIPENSSLTICDVTLNVASDSILICGGGTNGTTIIVGNCFTYTPNNNFTGFDTTCFIVCNDGLCDTTFVSIFVDPIPEIHCMDTTIYLDENGLTSLDTSYVLNQIIDNNLDSVWMASSGSFDCLDTGIVAITLFAQDSLGSLDSCIALVNIVDTIRPIVDCPSPQFVQVSIPTCEFEVLDYSSLVTTSDNCTSVGNISYEQTPMIGDSIDADDRTQVFTINVTDEHGNTNTCSFDVEFDCTIEVYFYEGFTPNGDGTNDTWVIEGIEKFPNAKLRILNRWGSIVYLSENGYNNNWDGKSTEGLTFNGDELPSGTYFYILELGNETDDSFKGYLYLKR